MKKTIRWLLFVFLTAGIIGATFYFRNNNRRSELPDILRREVIEYGEIKQVVSASGNIFYKDSVDLYFQRTGTVSSINIKPGDTVRKGNELAVLDTFELNQSLKQAEISLAQAELNLRTAQQYPDDAQIKLAKDAVTSAYQALEAAELGQQASRIDAANLIVDAERNRESAYITLRDASDGKRPSAQKSFDTAVEQEAIAQTNAELLIKQAEAQWWSAYQRYKQAERTLEQLQSPPDEAIITQFALQVRQAELNVQQAKWRIEDAILAAPFDGIITQVNLQEGVEPKSTEPAVKLADKSQLFLEINIDEIDIGKVVEGLTVSVALDAYPEAIIEGIVYSIAPAASSVVSGFDVSGIVSYKVKVLLTEFGDITLREGMTASADILTATTADILLIPNWAIRTDQTTGEIYCYRLDNNLPVRTPITLGILGDAFSQVMSGLTVGQEVGLIADERNLSPGNFQPGQFMNR